VKQSGGNNTDVQLFKNNQSSSVIRCGVKWLKVKTGKNT